MSPSPHLIAGRHPHSDSLIIVHVRVEVTMSFNYGREKRNFDRTWEQLETEYRAAGMSTEKIQKMKDFDWQWFCSERTYRNHVQALPTSDTVANCDQEHLEALSTQWDSGDVDQSRFGWMSAIENEELYHKLRSLSYKDLELLTLLYVDGFHQTDVAQKVGCSRNSVYKRLKKIKKILEEG